VSELQEEAGKPSTPTQSTAGDRELKQLLLVLEGLKKEMDRYLRVAAAGAEERYLDAAQVMKRAPNITQRLLESLAASTSAVQAFPLESNVRDAAKRVRLYYHETLERCFYQAALKHSGQWPSYVVGDVVRLHVDLEHGDAIIDGKRAGTLEPVRLGELLKVRLGELLEKSFDASAFLSRLRGAHEQVAAAQGRPIGDYTDIRQVFTALRAEMEPRGRSRYSEAKFGADLYRLCREGRPKTSDGLVLELSPAQDAAGGLYIPAQGGGNYIAALRFVGGQTGG
jgi:hypothetical protein